MKIGDEVQLIAKFTIDEYDKDNCAFEISVRAGNTVINWVIPIYIGILGIYPPGTRFVIPGDYLARDHPDYFKVLDHNKFIVEHNNRAYRVRMEENFRYNGKYKLEPIDHRESCVIRIAKQYTEERVYDICTSILGSDVDAEVVHGTVVRMYSKKNETPYYYDEFTDPIVKSNVPKFVVIHDELTNVEYTLPFEVLKKKL